MPEDIDDILASDQKEVTASNEKIPSWTTVRKACSAYVGMEVKYFGIKRRVNSFIKKDDGSNQWFAELVHKRFSPELAAYGDCQPPS